MVEGLGASRSATSLSRRLKGILTLTPLARKTVVGLRDTGTVYSKRKHVREVSGRRAHHRFGLVFWVLPSECFLSTCFLYSTEHHSIAQSATHQIRKTTEKIASTEVKRYATHKGIG